MSYGLHPYGGASYAGGKSTDAPGGGVITDPSRPDVVGYRWASSGSTGAYGQTSWAGGGAIASALSPAGGILAAPDADAGVVNVDAWWSESPYLTVSRVTEDGTATPVRGGYPLAVTTPTRRNRCTNPSGEADTTGWVQGANTAVSNPTDPSAPAGATVIRLTASAAGAVNVAVPTALSTTDPTGVSFHLRLSSAPSGDLTLTATWLIAADTSAGSTSTVTTTATISTASLAPYAGGFLRGPVLTVTPPTTGVLDGSLSLSIAGMAAGATADLDAVLAAANDLTGAYFDGDSMTGSWIGTPHLSESRLASAVRIVDGESPLDVPVRYELRAADQPSFRAVTEPVTLESRGRSWLWHPSKGQLEVFPEEYPAMAYDIEQGVFPIVGRRNPVVISASARQSAKATHKLATVAFSDRDRLRDLLSDGSPLLLRNPADLGYGLGEWIAVGAVTEAAPGHGAWEGTRHFNLPYQVVDPPALPAVA